MILSRHGTRKTGLSFCYFLAVILSRQVLKVIKVFALAKFGGLFEGNPFTLRMCERLCAPANDAKDFKVGCRTGSKCKIEHCSIGFFVYFLCHKRERKIFL